eukprot:gene7981-biopygen9124
MVRGRIAGAPTPDMYRKTRGVASRLRGRIAGAPTPDIWRASGWGAASGPPYSPLGAAPWVTGPPYRFRGRIAGAPTPDIPHGGSPIPPTGPPYSLRARSTGRGRIAGAPTPDMRMIGLPGLGTFRCSGLTNLLQKCSRGERDANPHGNYRIRPAGSGRLSGPGPYNSPWGAHGLRGRIIRPGGLTGCGPGGRLRARPTVYAPALQGGAVNRRGRIARPIGARGQSRFRRLQAYGVP